MLKWDRGLMQKFDGVVEAVRYKSGKIDVVRAYERRGEQDLLIKSPSAPGKTRPGTKIDIEFRIFRFHLHKRVDLQWP